MSPNIAKILMNASGPFWTAKAEVIHFLNPGRGHWALRDLLVDTTPLTRLNRDNELLPGTRIALCSVQQVQISLGEESYVWNRSANQAPDDPSIEEIKTGLANGQLALLLVETDPESWPPNLSSAQPEFTCLAGEINLDAMKPVNKARERLYRALTLSAPPEVSPERAARLPGLLSVHSSGLSIYGQIKLPWQADKPIQAPFQLARLLPDPGATPGYRLTIESERLTPDEKQAVVTAWTNLSRFVNPDNPLTQAATGQPLQAPAWVTLEVANPEALPRLYWLASPWQATPQSLDLHFERGEINILLSDRSPYQEPTSLARATLDDVGIAEENNTLTITVQSGQSPTGEPQGKSSYTAKTNSKGWEEAYTFNGLELAFSPIEAAQFLRTSQALPTPSWVQGSGKAVNPPILWGFMPLEDGWAQLPVPNLSEQIYLDAKLDYSGEPVPQNALFQGAVAYGNADDITDSQEEAALSGLQPWSLTLTGAQRIKEGKWTLVQSSGAWKIASIQLEIEAPEIIANGFLWFSTGKPTIQDALPDLDNWVSGVQQLALHTVKPSDPFPAPVTLGMRSLEFIRRQTTSTGGDETARPQLGSWSFSYDLQSELFEALAAQQVLPKQPFSTGAPLVWLRHPNLPMIQALPITESKEPPNFPNASRQLVPFELPLPGSAETPASWLFGVTQAEGAAYWPTLTSQAAAAPEWSSTADLPLVSLSLPGLILDPKGTQASKGSTPESFLPLKYRFDLPYTDQVNALAQLPKTPKDPNLTPLPDQPPPEPARPLLRGDLGENWQRLDERASLASADGVESLDEIEAAGDPGQASLRHLVEPLNWPVRTKIDLGQYPGSLALDNDGSEGAAPIELSGQQALEGISGEFISQDGNQLRRLSESETPPGTAFKIVAGSMAAYRETDGSYRDQRGLRRGATLSTQGEAELNLLRTPVSMAGEALYELVSSREPLKLRTHPQASTGQDWQIWFRDLPLQKNLFERKHSRSPVVQEYLLDVNDPEATSRDYNYLNGYEWRLKGPAAGALQIYNLPFYPLALEVLGVKDDKPVRLEISGRLQLPLQDSGEQVDLSNTVRLTFQAETGTGILALSAVALEAIPGENGEEQPGRGEWPLATAGGEAADAPLLTWSGASLNADRSSLRIEGGKLNFYLFDSPWAVELQGPLEFPAELGQDPKIRLEIDLKPDGGQSLAAQSVHLEIDMNPAHAHTVSVDISAALSGRRGNLQALYTFEEGGGRTVHDISGVGTPLDLTADDSQGLNWGPDGLSILASRKIASSGPATKIIQAVQATRELSVELWVTPADSNQKGPARILTISGNDTERNLTIGQGAPSYQERTSYNARVRTSAITLGGSVSSLLSRVKTTPTSLTYVVFTRDADGADRLFINGEEHDSGTVAGDFSNWDASYPLVLANETDGQLPWLGTYRLAAIYNRALSPFEVQEHFKRGASDLSWLLTQRGTFTATVTYQLLGAEGGKVSWKSGRLFDDLVIETTTGDPTTPSILANDTTLQFKWQHYSPDNPEYRLQLLPGMHLAEESASPEGETRPADAPGFATLEFTPLPGGAVPELRLRSAFLEALITCHWGSFLQTSRTTGAPQPASPEQVFSSSAGNLALGYTTRWQAGHWEEAFLLNGCLEVKDLISWPKNMQFDPNTKQLTLPAIRPGEAPADLNHYRHSIRVLFNQHTIPAEALNTGKEQLLFNFADGWSWQFLAVVEHQLVEVSIPEGGEAIWLGSERRWTALQEVRMASPYAFKRFLTFLDGKRTTSPTKPTSEDLEDVNFSYLGSGLRNILASQGGALDGLAQEGRTLLVEASALHWIKQSPLDMPTATTLQFLPGGSQLGLLSSPQDYAPSDPADPRWLLLATPFLGRLQDQGDDGLEEAAPVTGSPLKVDPLWLIQQTRSDGKPLPELALALTAWSETQEQVITFSAMDTAAARTWSRLDPIALEENWFRLHACKTRREKEGGTPWEA